jgi:hypothetical protein
MQFTLCPDVVFIVFPIYFVFVLWPGADFSAWRLCGVTSFFFQLSMDTISQQFGERRTMFLGI